MFGLVHNPSEKFDGTCQLVGRIMNPAVIFKVGADKGGRFGDSLLRMADNPGA